MCASSVIHSFGNNSADRLLKCAAQEGAHEGAPDDLLIKGGAQLRPSELFEQEADHFTVELDR